MSTSIITPLPGAKRPKIVRASYPTTPMKQPLPPRKVKPLERPDFGNLGDLVTFVIGPGQKKVQLHKNPVCCYSLVLKRAFASSFKEGTTQTYVLEDVTEPVFALFSKWVYSQTLLSGSYNRTEMCQTLPRLWIMADKFMIPQLQNHAIDAMGKLRTDSYFVTYPRDFNFIYDNTSPNSPLRKFIVQEYARTMNNELMIDFFPKQMLLDLVNYQSVELGRYPKFLTSLDIKDYYVKEELENGDVVAK